MPRADLVRRASVALARSADVAGRPFVVLDEDLPVVDALSGGRAASLGILRALRSTGQAERVRRGTYVLRDTTGVVRTDVLDLIDALTPAPYLVTAGRALELRGLSDQRFRRIVVLTPTARRPFGWRGDEVRYAAVDEQRIWGDRRTAGALVASPDRALLDALAQRSWGVSLSQCVEALDRALARDPAFLDVLARSASRYRNAAVARRLGLLTERVAGRTAGSVFEALRGTSKAATPLDPTGPPDGPIDRRWNVRVNVDVDQLLAHHGPD